MTNPPPNARLRLRYCKDEVLQYVGHRDLLRLVLRIIRQAEIPFAYSGGFSPKPKVSFAPALSLGVLADNELVDIELAPGAAYTAADLIATGQRLREAAAPRRFCAGLELLPGGAPSLAQCISSGRYELEFNADCAELRPLLEAQSMPAEHKGKPVDLRPAITHWRLAERVLHIDASVSTPPMLNIVRLANYIEEHAGLAAESITRRCLLDSQGQPL
jgi:radical SAM-linked protein